MSFWAPLALTVTAAALLAVPVAPALFELRKRRDASPLPTSLHDGRIANFAEVFASRIDPLRPQLELCRIRRELSRTSIENMEVLLIGNEDFDFDPALTSGIAALMCSQAAVVPSGRVVEADVYADSVLELGEGAALRAALGAADITLGRNSTVLRWLHARGSVYLREGSIACGRLSADQSIYLEKGCRFERMQAPLIVTFDPAKQGLLSDHQCQCASDPEHPANDSEGVFASSRQRLRIHGDFTLPAGETLDANVIVTGKLRIGLGARLFGSTKAYGDVIVEENACVHGSIVSEGTISLGPRSFVTGPVMAESDVMMAAGSCAGVPDAPTTVSSYGVQLAIGCRLHGTVWARKQGIVGA